jgi:hypothetical protein
MQHVGISDRRVRRNVREAGARNGAHAKRQERDVAQPVVWRCVSWRVRAQSTHGARAPVRERCDVQRSTTGDRDIAIRVDRKR